MYSGKIYGQMENMTIVLYQGDDAEQVRDILRPAIFSITLLPGLARIYLETFLDSVSSLEIFRVFSWETSF
jgi:hypothetical protein